MAKLPTRGAQGGVIGRPPKPPPADAAERIEQLAAEGRPVVGVAVSMKTTREVLRRWMSEHPELSEAFERGRERERHELHQILINNARDGEKPNINAMFILKCRHAYREGDPGEQPQRISVTFNLPGAMTRGDFLRTVVADETPTD